METSTVPNYFRYGETETSDTADLVHCQAIFSRISEQNWEIRPHRHNHLCQLFLVSEGELNAVLELERVTLIGPCALVVPTGKVHGFSYGEGARGTMISVSEGFLRGALENAGCGYLRHGVSSIQVIQLAGRGDSLAQLESLFSAVETEASQRKAGFLPALAALLQLIFVQLDRNREQQAAYRVADVQGASFERFRELVGRQLRSHVTVAEYCRQLGIGERRLNRICRAIAGESPLNYIHRQLVEEAKRCLVHTAMPITSVGYELGFEDSAYFSRFFKKHTGVSPSEFAARYRG